MTDTAQTYILSQEGATFFRGFLFVKTADDLELVDSFCAPLFSDGEIFQQLIRQKWYRKDVKEFSVSNIPSLYLDLLKLPITAQTNILIDVGSAQTSFVYTAGESFGTKQENTGVGDNIESLLQQKGFQEELLKIFPLVENDQDDIINFIAEQKVYPARLPYSWKERLLLGFVLRGVMKEISQKYARYLQMQTPGRRNNVGRLVLTGGPFVSTQEKIHEVSALGLFAAMDSVLREGIWQVVHDSKHLAGALSRLAKDTILHTSINHYFNEIATVIVLTHDLAPGQEVGIIEFDAGMRNIQKIRVISGEVVRIPYEKGEEGRLSIELSSHATIKGIGDISTEPLPVVGGELGIVVDARGVQSQVTKESVRHHLEALGL